MAEDLGPLRGSTIKRLSGDTIASMLHRYSQNTSELVEAFCRKPCEFAVIRTDCVECPHFKLKLK